jgi:protein-S-isoprenylcysteine O-methyltransferase Ste14
LFSYLFFLGTFLYLIGFVWGLAVPKGIDDGQPGSVAGALATNALLLVIFGLQHSIMARPSFKAWWTTVIPKPAERSTYVLMATAVTALLMWGWQPIPYVLWDVDGSVAGMGLFAISALGWGIVLLSTFQVDHFALFGLKQGAYYLLQRRPSWSAASITWCAIRSCSASSSRSGSRRG